MKKDFMKLVIVDDYFPVDNNTKMLTYESK